MSAPLPFELVICICSLFHALHSLEIIAAQHRGKLVLIHLVRQQTVSTHSWYRLPARRQIFEFMMVVRLATAVVTVLLVLVGAWYWPSLAVLSVTTYYYSWYRTVGGDASEEMGLIVVIACTFASSPLRTEYTPVVVLYFIASLSLLSYFVAGVSKLSSRTWLNGSAIQKITRTEEYGHPIFHRIVEKFPHLGRLLTWATLGFEVFMPLAIFVWPSAVTIFVLVGILFHVSCAWIMGLNGFPLSFCATYPAIVFMSDHLRG